MRLLHIVLQGKRVIINGQSSPLSLFFEPLLGKLKTILSAGNGDCRTARVGTDFLKEFGNDLYRVIFPPESELANNTSEPIVLDIKERGLSQFPWELMRQNGVWLAKTRGIVRVSGQGGGRRGGNINAPLKVLVALASPIYDPEVDEPFQPDPINLRSQMEIFTRGLSRKRFAANFYIQQHITRSRLSDELAKDYHVLHFVGHGSRGSLSLEDDYACVDEIDTAWLRENLCNSSLQLALFNSCYTASNDPAASCAGIAKTLLDAGIPLVVGMQFAISEGAARVFACKFYRILSEGNSIVDAITMARRAIADCPGCRPWEWITPVLFIQPDILDDIQQPFVRPLSSPSPHAIKILKPKKPVLVAVEGDEFFVGQRREMVQILKTLSFAPYQPERAVVLKGAAGVGKTALAVQAANRILSQMDCLVWVSGRTTPPPVELAPQTLGNDSLTLVKDEKDIFVQIAQKLGMKLKGTENLLSLKEKILHRLNKDKKTLLFLDNMEAFQNSEILQTFINQLPLNCRTLVTSRYSLPGIKAKGIEVLALSRQETFKLIYYCLSKPIEKVVCQQIYQVSGGNPLVTRFLLALNYGDGYWFEQKDKMSRAKPAYLFDYLFRQSLQKAGREGRAVFAALSLFKPHARQDALAYTCRYKNISSVVNKLRSLSLVEIDKEKHIKLPGPGRAMANKLAAASPLTRGYRRRQAFFMTRLVRSQLKLLQPQIVTPLVREVLEEEAFLGENPFGDKESINKQAIKELLEKNICQSAMETLSREKENAMSALLWCCHTPHLPLLRILVDNLSLFFSLQSNWTDMIKVQRLALQTLRQAGQREAESVLLNNLGVAYRHLGNLPQALRLQQKAIALKEELGDMYGLAQSYNNLGLIYKAQGQWKQALLIYQRNLFVFHQMGDRKSKANTFNNLGLLYQSQGNWEKALINYQEALKLKEDLEDTVGVAQSQNNLGLIYQNLGNWTLAEQLYRKSLEIFYRLGNTQSSGQTYSNLALLYYDQEKYDLALELYQQALDIFNELGDGFGLAQTYNNLGLVYKEIGDNQKACSLYKQSLELKESLGDLHGLAQTYNNMGVIYKTEQNWSAARDCYRQSIELKYRLGDSHGMGLSYANLGLLELNCRNYDSALKLLERAANLFMKGGDEENLQKVMRAMFAANCKLQESA